MCAPASPGAHTPRHGTRAGRVDRRAPGAGRCQPPEMWAPRRDPALRTAHKLASATTPARPAPTHPLCAQEQQLEQAIKDAEEACDGGKQGECAAAWDNVSVRGGGGAAVVAESKGGAVSWQAPWGAGGWRSTPSGSQRPHSNACARPPAPTPPPHPNHPRSWQVEEISAAISHKKAADKANNANDPLEQFCGDNPDADECRCAGHGGGGGRGGRGGAQGSGVAWRGVARREAARSAVQRGGGWQGVVATPPWQWAGPRRSHRRAASGQKQRRADPRTPPPPRAPPPACTTTKRQALCGAARQLASGAAW